MSRRGSTMSKACSHTPEGVSQSLGHTVAGQHSLLWRRRCRQVCQQAGQLGTIRAQMGPSAARENGYATAPSTSACLALTSAESFAVWHFHCTGNVAASAMSAPGTTPGHDPAGVLLQPWLLRTGERAGTGEELVGA